MKHLAWLWMALLIVLSSVDAYAQDTGSQSAPDGNSIAVMKLDTEGNVNDSLRSSLLDAIRTEVLNSNRPIDARGGEVSYLEMQILTNCDRAASIACYEAATDMLGAAEIISGTIKDDGTAKLIWYVTGKGIFRTVEGPATDIESSTKLAQRLIIGDMGSLVVTSNIPGANILIDGKRMGMTAEFLENAQKIKLVAGTYIVSVRMDGYTSQDPQKIEIAGDKESVVNFDLAVAVDQSKMQRVFKYTGWALLGTGVASMIAGTGLYAAEKVYEGKLRDYHNKHMNDKDSTSISDFGFEIIKGSSPNEIKDDMDNIVMARNVTVGVGAGLAVIGTTMVLLGYFYNFGSDEAVAAMPKVNFAITPDYQGMGLQWQF